MKRDEMMLFVICYWGFKNNSNKKSQSNLGRAASPPLTERRTTPQSPHWLQLYYRCPSLTSKTAPSRSSPFYTLIPRPTPLTTPNGIEI